MGSFAEGDSISMDQLREMTETMEDPTDSASVASIEEALAALPACVLREGEEQGILYGQSPTLNQFEELDTEVGADQNVRILSSRGEVLAIGRTPLLEAEPVIRLERVLVETHA